MDGREGLGRRYPKGRKILFPDKSGSGLKPLQYRADKMLDVKGDGKINDFRVLADRNVSIFIIKTMAYESLEIKCR